MTPEQVKLVQESFKLIEPIAPQAADIFYDRLFTIAPQVRGLFPNDLSKQKEKLMSMLTTAVSNLHQVEKILPAVFGVLATRADIIMLIKPQFEVGRQHVGKGGVVRDPALHRSVVARLARYSVLRGWHVLGVSASPLRGPKGNREFFLHISSQGRTAANIETLINRTVEALA